MRLEFGKKVRIGNFYMLKYSKSLSSQEVKKLRSADRIPEEAQRSLSRGSLPYIKISTVSGSWSVEFAVGLTMYEALNAVDVVVDGEGVYQLYGVEERNVHAMIVAMFADTTTVGDMAYNVEKQKLLSSYIERQSKSLNSSADGDKDGDTLRSESDAAVGELLDDERHSEAVAGLSAIVKGEEGGAS